MGVWDMKKERILQISLTVVAIGVFAVIFGIQLHRSNETKPKGASQTTTAQTATPEDTTASDNASLVSIIATITSTPGKTPAQPPATASKTTSVRAPATASKPAPAQTPAASKSAPAQSAPGQTAAPNASKGDTRPQAPAVTKTWFQNEFARAERQYISELEAELAACQKQLEPWEDEVDRLAAEQLLKQRQLAEQYANMGLLNSGQYQNALNRLNSTYRSKIRNCEEQMAPLKQLEDDLQQQLKYLDLNYILAIIAVDNGFTAEQVIDYYEQFIG